MEGAPSNHEENEVNEEEEEERKKKKKNKNSESESEDAQQKKEEKKKQTSIKGFDCRKFCSSSFNWSRSLWANIYIL